MSINLLLTILSPLNLLMLNIGVATGIIIGALPGLTVVLAITILLPLTFGMDSITGMFLLLGAYCGGVYGGSFTAILINTPGTPAAAATVIDGYPMTQKGRSGDALLAALIASVFGGVISCFSLMFIAPQLAKVALSFGPPEYFALCIFGLSMVSSISGTSVLKSLIMASTGLFLSTVGVDATEAVPRFTFGAMDLFAGINPVILMLGVFAISEMLEKSRLVMCPVKKISQISKVTIKLKDFLFYWKTLILSSLYGVFIGATPGTGGAIAAFFSYREAKRRSKSPEKFGTGEIEGVIASETANNAVTGATLIPLLTLGIPGDIGVAVMLGALLMQGIMPGPELFASDRSWVYSIMGGLMVANIFMLFQGLFFIRIFAKVIKLSNVILIPSVMILCTIGAFAVINSAFDIYLMLGFGLFGYLLRRYDFPIPPLAIALVLGSLTENNLRRSLILSRGNVSIFFTRPLSLVFLIMAIMSIIFPFIKSIIMYLKEQKSVEEAK